MSACIQHTKIEKIKTSQLFYRSLSSLSSFLLSTSTSTVYNFCRYTIVIVVARMEDSLRGERISTENLSNPPFFDESLDRPPPQTNFIPSLLFRIFLTFAFPFSCLTSSTLSCLSSFSFFTPNFVSLTSPFLPLTLSCLFLERTLRNGQRVLCISS